MYLSSFRLGDHPEQLVEMVGANKRVAVIANSIDYGNDPERRKAGVQREIDDLNKLGFQAEELDLRKYFNKSNELEQTLTEFGAPFKKTVDLGTTSSQIGVRVSTFCLRFLVTFGSLLSNNITDSLNELLFFEATFSDGETFLPARNLPQRLTTAFILGCSISAFRATLPPALAPTRETASPLSRRLLIKLINLLSFGLKLSPSCQPTL